MWSTLALGVLLGLSAGLSPGPLSVLVISQSLRFGAREGMRVALAPLLSDVPIVVIALLLVRQIASNSTWLGVIGLVGAGVVFYLAWETFRAHDLPTDATQESPRSMLRGVLVNWLSPNPWLFWISVGAPIVFQNLQQDAGWGAAVSFVAGFYALLVGSKLAVALLAARSRQWLSGAAYRWLMRALGVALAVFALLLLRDAVHRLSFG